MIIVIIHFLRWSKAGPICLGWECNSGSLLSLKQSISGRCGGLENKTRANESLSGVSRQDKIKPFHCRLTQNYVSSYSTCRQWSIWSLIITDNDRCYEMLMIIHDQCWSFSHHQQGRIDFNTVMSTGKDFLIPVERLMVRECPCSTKTREVSLDPQDFLGLRKSLWHRGWISQILLGFGGAWIQSRCIRSNGKWRRVQMGSCCKLQRITQASCWSGRYHHDNISR